MKNSPYENMNQNYWLKVRKSLGNGHDVDIYIYIYDLYLFTSKFWTVSNIKTLFNKKMKMTKKF